MMKRFIVILKDKKKEELEAELLVKHIEHLREMNREGKLIIAGPFKNDEQGLLILSCGDLGEAITLVESDPFINEKYYQSYEINEFIAANEENNWLMDTPQTSGNLVH